MVSINITNAKGLLVQVKDRIFPAIDVDTLDEARRLLDQLIGEVTYVKLGLQIATQVGWAACIKAASERGFRVFCDSKFKDIPNTLEKAAKAMANHSPAFFTVMADTNLESLQSIKKGVNDATENRPKTEQTKIIAVTVLTSISPDECQTIYGGNVKDKVLSFGQNARLAGLDAIVCSPEEIEIFRSKSEFDDILIITPGIRPLWSAPNDQSRIETPASAIKKGADMLVIGRPITQPPKDIGSPKQAIRKIIAEIEEALDGRT